MLEKKYINLHWNRMVCSNTWSNSNHWHRFRWICLFFSSFLRFVHWSIISMDAINLGVADLLVRLFLVRGSMVSKLSERNPAGRHSSMTMTTETQFTPIHRQRASIIRHNFSGSSPRVWWRTTKDVKRVIVLCFGCVCKNKRNSSNAPEKREEDAK